MVARRTGSRSPVDGERCNQHFGEKRVPVVRIGEVGDVANETRPRPVAIDQPGLLAPRDRHALRLAIIGQRQRPQAVHRQFIGKVQRARATAGFGPGDGGRQDCEHPGVFRQLCLAGQVEMQIEQGAGFTS